MRTLIYFCVCILCLLTLPASALITGGSGNRPVQDHGWPAGALAVANLESRAAWWEGPPFGVGEWHFLYCGKTDAFNQALKAFAAIHAPQLDLVVHDDPPAESPFLEKSKKVDWTFTIWDSTNWNNFYSNPKTYFSTKNPDSGKPLPPPRLDVYISSGGGVDWSLVKPPHNVRLIDERAASNAAQSPDKQKDKK